MYTFTLGGTAPAISTCGTPIRVVSGVAACTFVFAGPLTGSIAYTATYSGDPNLLSSANTTSITAVQSVLSASAVNYTATWANPGPAAQAPVAIASTAGPVTGLTLSAAPAGSCGWVNLSLSATATPANLVTSINAAGYANLGPGVYPCTVTISGTAGTPAAAVTGAISVTLTVSPLTGFAGATNGGGGTLLLTFPSPGNLFGYFVYLSSGNWMYHADLGYEYFIAANDAGHGFYMYDLKSGHWWYSSPTLFPYLYDFSLNAWLYYFPSTSLAGHYTTNPRYFANLTTGAIFTM
jgi:hypothetical protein